MALPPPPYNPGDGGQFLLEVSGGTSNETIRLSAFAGCFDKVIGVEYEDCYFTTRPLSTAVAEWLTDMLTANNLHRNLTVTQVDITGAAVATLDIRDAFLREVRISDLDASDNSFGDVSFVVVPRQLESQAPGSVGNGTNLEFWRRSQFQVDIDGVDGGDAVAVRALRVSWPKVPAPIGGGARLEFQPGQPLFDDIVLEAAALRNGAVTNTVTDLEAWVAEAPTPLARAGVVNLLDDTRQVVLGHVDLFGLVPRSFPTFPTGANRRSIILHADRFTFTVAP